MSNKADKNQLAKVENPSLIPKMRFPEFKQPNSWEIKRLGQVLSIGNGRDYKHLSSGNVPVYGSGGYMLSVDDYLYDGESVCIGRKGTIDKPIFLSGKFWTVDTLFYTHSFKKCLPKFAYSIFQKIKWQDHNEAGGVPSLSKTNIEKIEVAIPTVAEQQKIADCLSSIDELIFTETKKLDAFKMHKKGLMQSLFPAEGETVPTLRFSEFQYSEEWEGKLLGEVVKSVKTGKLDANAMVKNGQYRFYTCAKNYYQIDEYAFDGEALLIAGNGAYLGYIHHYIGKFNAYQRTYVLQKFDVNVTFLKCLLDRYLPMRIHLEKKDGNTPYIVLSTITEMPLLIPKDGGEQQRIADYLTSIDDLISAQNKKITALKTFKKGLMQQLFPSVKDVQE